MEFINLASGSKGNGSLIIDKGTIILVDAGMNITPLKKLLKERNLTLNDIDFILLTHNHNDHIKNIEKFDISKIYCLKGIKKLEDKTHYLTFNKKYDFKNVKVELLKTSHDAFPSCGFIFKFENDEKLGFITDSGYLSFDVLEKLKNLEYYYFESNYDISLLVFSSRSDELKTRILSRKGHLSNEQAAIYLSYLIGEKTKKIMLAHLSEECNTKFSCLETLFNIFNDNSINYDKYDIKCASQKEVTIL